MGPAIDALRPALAVSREHPSFLLVALATLVGSAVGSVVVSHIPVVGDLVNAVVATPVLTALLVGMAAAGLVTDAASIGDGVESLRSNYRSLLGAYALLVAGVLLVVAVWAVDVAVVVAIDAGVDPSIGAASLDPAALAGSGPVLGVTLAAFGVALLGGVVVQFFDVAIVVHGASAVASFGVSWRVFREAPASVLGYSALRMLPVAAAGGVVAAGYLVGGSLFGPFGGPLVALLVATLVGPATFAFLSAYHVAYYATRVGGDPPAHAPPRQSAREFE